jgi:lipopolysaccharide cholinephosphotransferase
MNKAENGIPISDAEAKGMLAGYLKTFADFCNANSLTYFLGGGTLLGAVRHCGFIPWDDDIDVLMPRPDYDKFLYLTQRSPIKQNLVVMAPDRTKGYLWPFAKVVDTDTSLVELQYKRKYSLRMLDQGYGLYIDVFPIDGIPDSRKEQERFFRRIIRYTKGLQRATYTLENAKPFYRFILRLAVYPAYAIIGPGWFLRKLERLAGRYDYEKQSFVAACFGSYGIREAIKKTQFIHSVQVEFENRYYNAPIGYDAYLSSLYGDYMKIPPENKRISHHKRKLYRTK